MQPTYMKWKRRRIRLLPSSNVLEVFVLDFFKLRFNMFNIAIQILYIMIINCIYICTAQDKQFKFKHNVIFLFYGQIEA